MNTTDTLVSLAQRRGLVAGRRGIVGWRTRASTGERLMPNLNGRERKSIIGRARTTAADLRRLAGDLRGVGLLRPVALLEVAADILDGVQQEVRALRYPSHRPEMVGSLTPHQREVLDALRRANVVDEGWSVLRSFGGRHRSHHRDTIRGLVERGLAAARRRTDTQATIRAGGKEYRITDAGRTLLEPPQEGSG